MPERYRYLTTTTTADTSDGVCVVRPSQLTDTSWEGTNVIAVCAPPTVKAKRSIMTANFSEESNRSLCGFCCGKKYDPKHRGASRKCQRCRGKGFTVVNRIKR